MKRQRPAALVELLRLAVVVFFAAAGYELGFGLSPDESVLGPLDGVAVGVILGSAIGYVLGGLVGRRTLTAVETTTHRLREASAEQLLAGSVGATLGAVTAAAVAWPVFFVPEPLLAFPLYAFAIFATAVLGHRLATARALAVISLVGAGGPATAAGPDPAPRVIDASVAADGRILDVVRAGFLTGCLLLPGAVLSSLEADSRGRDTVSRRRARRALEVLERLRREPDVQVEVVDLDGGDEEPEAVEQVLLRLAADRGATLLTADPRLARTARDADLAVQDVNALAFALRPPISAGDDVTVLLVRAGKDAGQAVGFLDDGTMVVVERARRRIGQEVTVRIASVLMADKGRIVFGQQQP